MNPLKRAFFWTLERESLTRKIDSRVAAVGPAPLRIPQSFRPGNHPRNQQQSSRGGNASIAITARFRSGSTLLWRLLRGCEGTTAYYEPLNPRCWFDPLRRGDRVDQSHRGVDDYWSEYTGLPDAQWDDRWPSSDLYLSRLQPMHGLYNYINTLIRHADGRCVLQFNRLDFRLEWMRHRYPEMQIIHLVRNPRDQWISTFLKREPVDPKATIQDFRGHDEFYLLAWAEDLARYIPLFAEIDSLHPYEVSYLIWKLSHVFASNFSDHVVEYERLVTDPKETLDQLGSVVGTADLANSPDIASIDNSSVGRWQNYASESWFAEREAHCQTLLEQFVFCDADQSTGNA